MKILVADDDPSVSVLLQGLLGKWGYDVVSVDDGEKAWEILQEPDGPPIALMDWKMPGLTGIEVARKVRENLTSRAIYIIILTASKKETTDISTGLNAGADDFLLKPFQAVELRARIQVGVRIVTLQLEMARRIRDLEKALGEIKTLKGLLPICAWCGKVRDDKGYWTKVEEYLSKHTEIKITHAVCSDCKEKYLQDLQKHSEGEE